MIFNPSYDNKKYRLEEDWKYIYAFDLNGNVITKQEKNFGKTWSFSYSSENQLTAIDITEGAQVTNIDFTYDALGRRTSKTIIQNGVTTVRKFVYDNQEIIAELDGNNQILVRYTQSGLRTDDTLAMDVTNAGVTAGLAPSAGTYYFLKDGLGSIIDIANSTGTVVQHYVYSSFGKLLKIENGSTDNTANPNIKTPYSYTNREYDQESGLYYYRARYYDAHSGRFLQEDLDSGRQSDPLSVFDNYGYGANSPTNFVDPSGLDFWSKNFSSVTRFYARNKELIDKTAITVAIVGAGAVTGGAAFVVFGAGTFAAGASAVLTTAAITGAISGGIAAMNGSSGTQIYKSILGGASAGAIAGAGALIGGAAAGFGSALGVVAGGAGGALGGYYGAEANAQIAYGRGASPQERGFGALAGAIGGAIGSAVVPGSLGSGAAGAVNDSSRAITTGFTDSGPSWIPSHH